MDNIIAITTYLSIISLNVNKLNALIKRHRVAEWIRKKDPYICCLQEVHFLDQKTHTDWKKRNGKKYLIKIETKKN